MEGIIGRKKNKAFQNFIERIRNICLFAELNEHLRMSSGVKF